MSNRTPDSHLYVVPAEGGEAKQLTTDGHAWRPHWSPDGKEVFFEGIEDKAGNLWAVSVEGGVERALTDFSGKRGSLARLATDGEYLYFTWEEDLGDIWVMDVVTDESE